MISIVKSGVDVTMKAQVIFYSALAFIDLVATSPYAVNLQRYSGQYQAGPTLESNFQSHPQRSYQNIGPRPYDAVYNNPLHYQEQELPSINQEHYFSSNPHYVSSGPVHIQPEVSNDHYINQQRLPSQYYTHAFKQPIIHTEGENWRGPSQQISKIQPIHVKIDYPEVILSERDAEYQNYQQHVTNSNRHQETARNEEIEVPSAPREYPIIRQPINENRGLVSNSPHQATPTNVQANHFSIDSIPQLHSLPQIIIEEKFAPSIPSVPPRNIFSSNEALKRVNNHHLQVEPVPQQHVPVIHSPPNQYEHGLPLNTNEKNLAHASNPVEQIPESQPPKPTLESVISNPRIQNLLFTNKHKKRYLVIHPNGTIEHVDKLETVAQQHPNYILVNAGDIVPNGKNNGTASPVISPDKKIVAPVNEKVPILTHEPTHDLDIIPNQPSTHAPGYFVTSTPTPVAATATPVPVIPTPVPVTLAQATTSAPAVQAVASASGPNATAVASGPHATAIATAPAPATATTSQATSIPRHPQAESTNTTSFTPRPQTEPTTPTLEAQTTAPILQPGTTPAPVKTTTPQIVHPPKTEVEKEVLPPSLNTNTNADVKPKNVPQATATARAESNTSTPPVTSTVKPTQTTPINPTASTPKLTPNTEEVISVTASPVKKSTKKPDSTTVTVVEIEDHPHQPNSGPSKAPLVVPYDQAEVSPNSGDQLVVDQLSKSVQPTPDKKVPDLGSSGIVDRVKEKPVVWFRTADPNFWKKLQEKNTDFDVVYFFQINNQPKIVHDTKSTVFPNGTILEEFTETTWEYEGAEPTVKKTTKLIYPEDQ